MSIQNHHLDWLEAESIYIIREVIANAQNPALLFSGGKDSVVLLALVGIVLGAVVFKGFEILWDRFDRLVVVVLGVVVTGVIVGIVHALRTSRDGLSMFLAAVAGLVLTFGPLLVVM
mgnify:CR=1 FL=1